LDSAELLLKWCRFGWKYRHIGDMPPEAQTWYADRVKYEYGLIVDRDFQDVFLVVSDAIRYAKDHGIAVGPGRGSVAASVVGWLLRIHEINPRNHPGLLFERFLDATRADPPDIDTDFDPTRRHEVREYLEAKYGRESVGQVGNFIRYLGKNALVDVARVYNVPHAAKNIVANLLPVRSGGDSRFDATLEDTERMFPAAAKVFENFPDLRKAIALEGDVRGMSVHAAGLVVTNGPLTDICAIYEKDGVQVMGVDKYGVEDLGGIKLDFLGLTTMAVISRTLDATGLTLNDLYAIPLDDEGTLQGFRDVDVVGCFQFEGRATRLVTRDVQPRDFTELSDVNALSRPGPLFSSTTFRYIDIRHGREEIEHLHPIVDAITERTKGQIIYQEQILQILRDIGGFDWFSVGQIRRIISKKVGEAAFQMSWEKFKAGSQELHDMEEKLADKLWKLMVTSGTYSFVTAHAVCYTLIGYWCMWLKKHYPLEFYAASLAFAGDAEQEFKLMQDAQNHGYKIHPPRLELSRSQWVGVPGLGLVAGWQQVPRIGEKLATRIDEYLGSWPVLDGEPLRPGSWQELKAVSGLGDKKIHDMELFSLADDPFGLKITERKMRGVFRWLRQQHRIPRPTHSGAEVAAIPMAEGYGATALESVKFRKGPRVIYAGVVKERNMQDVVENRRSRTGASEEEIIATLKRPDLLEYCSLRCFDNTEEEVYLRINRFDFPKLKRTIESIAVGHDVVIAVGNRIAGFGTPVMVSQLYVVDPD
jgi:DNA polymerase-3 subunit alpha